MVDVWQIDWTRISLAVKSNAKRLTCQLHGVIGRPINLYKPCLLSCPGRRNIEYIPKKIIQPRVAIAKYTASPESLEVQLDGDD